MLEAYVTATAFLIGWNFGYRFIQGALRDRGFHVGNRRLLTAMHHANPQAFRVRLTGAARRLIRQGHFDAPHDGALWQSDLNCVLQDYGLVHGIVYDVGTHSVCMLQAMTTRLTTVVWLQCNREAALREGLPDVCVTRLERKVSSSPPRTTHSLPVFRCFYCSPST